MEQQFELLQNTFDKKICQAFREKNLVVARQTPKNLFTEPQDYQRGSSLTWSSRVPEQTEYWAPVGSYIRLYFYKKDQNLNILKNST